MAAQQARVYPIESQKDAVELHTWPIGIVDHALGLVGGPAIKQLQDIAMPASKPGPEGDKADWKSFGMKFDPATEGKQGAVTHPGGRWVAFPRNNGYIVTILTSMFISPTVDHLRGVGETVAAAADTAFVLRPGPDHPGLHPHRCHFRGRQGSVIAVSLGIRCSVCSDSWPGLWDAGWQCVSEGTVYSRSLWLKLIDQKHRAQLLTIGTMALSILCSRTL